MPSVRADGRRTGVAREVERAYRGLAKNSRKVARARNGLPEMRAKVGRVETSSA